MADLANRSCVPCSGGVPPLQGAELADFHGRLGGDWNLVDGHHLHKEFHFPDFRQALHFVNLIGELAESEGHHPDLTLSWGLVGVSLFTHKIDGLSESDFVLAAKIDRLDRSGR